MTESDVRREDGLDPWGYPEIPVEEYAPAQVSASETRTQHPVCKSCWTATTSPQEPCRACGRPPGMSDVAWYRLLFTECSRCGHELKEADEGGCPECGLEKAA